MDEWNRGEGGGWRLNPWRDKEMDVVMENGGINTWWDRWEGLIDRYAPVMGVLKKSGDCR